MTLQLTEDERAGLESIAEELSAHPRLRAVSKAVNAALDETAEEPTDYGLMLVEEDETGTPSGWPEMLGDVAGPEDLHADVWRP